MGKSPARVRVRESPWPGRNRRGSTADDGPRDPISQRDDPHVLRARVPPALRHPLSPAWPSLHVLHLLRVYLPWSTSHGPASCRTHKDAHYSFRPVGLGYAWCSGCLDINFISTILTVQVCLHMDRPAKKNRTSKSSEAPSSPEIPLLSGSQAKSSDALLGAKAQNLKATRNPKGS